MRKIKGHSPPTSVEHAPPGLIFVALYTHLPPQRPPSFCPPARAWSRSREYDKRTTKSTTANRDVETQNAPHELTRCRRSDLRSVQSSYRRHAQSGRYAACGVVAIERLLRRRCRGPCAWAAAPDTCWRDVSIYEHRAGDAEEGGVGKEGREDGRGEGGRGGREGGRGGREEEEGGMKREGAPAHSHRVPLRHVCMHPRLGSTTTRASTASLRYRKTRAPQPVEIGSTRPTNIRGRARRRIVRPSEQSNARDDGRCFAYRCAALLTREVGEQRGRGRGQRRLTQSEFQVRRQGEERAARVGNDGKQRRHRVERPFLLAGDPTAFRASPSQDQPPPIASEIADGVSSDYAPPAAWQDTVARASEDGRTDVGRRRGRTEMPEGGAEGGRGGKMEGGARRRMGGKV
ncbi:hypothetical protein B0H10DRAFT_2250864 [Mycena sp. CBHHK59/15]|nr:hypothetical protein B0H10DRAFT_2250864 [Mycena sp. CBHHK59/15]